jgi:hypothetical protein
MATIKEKRDYTTSELFLGNAVVITWIMLGTVACSLFNIFIGLAFFTLSAFLVYYQLGKKGCLSCFYCKTCTIGFGKLFEVFFSKRGTENLNRKALKLFPYVYLLLAVVPIAFVLVSGLLTQQFSALQLGLVAAILLVSLISGFARRKNLLPAKPSHLKQR